MDKKPQAKSPLSLAQILGYFAAGFVVLCIVMFAAGFCPPAGPWPMPPWCSADKAFVVPSGPGVSSVPTVAASAVPSISAVASSKPASEASPTPVVAAPSVFVPKPLDYLTARPEATKNITYGVGMFDIWGNVCHPDSWMSQCEDSTKHVDDSFDRAKSIGSGLILVTDFAGLNKDLSMSFINSPFSGAHTFSQDELTAMASKAHATGQKLMLITNLYDNEKGARDGVVYENPSSAMLDTLFSGWTSIIEAQAKKAKAAGVDYFIVNSRDVELSYDAKGADLDGRYEKLALAAKAGFGGKVCGWGTPFAFDPQGKFAGKLDCYVFDWGVKYIFEKAEPNVASMQQAWEDYFALSEVTAFSTPEKYVLLLMPSYEGAYRSGWVEPVAIYSDGQYPLDWKTQAMAYEALFRAIDKTPTKLDGVISYGYWWTDAMPPVTWMRSDISQSIRGKDAEQVFYEWAKR